MVVEGFVEATEYLFDFSLFPILRAGKALGSSLFHLLSQRKEEKAESAK